MFTAQTTKDCLDQVHQLVQKRTADWDPSHDYQHACRVLHWVDKLIENESDVKLSEEDCLVVRISALVHDLVDPKYNNPDVAKVQLQDDLIYCGLPKSLACAVLAIIEQISYSKEAKGELDMKLWTPHRIHLRNLVSDADKLDAIGLSGIYRCQEFIRHKLKVLDTQRIDELCRDHCYEKLLKLTPNYIRTVQGQMLAQPLHQEIVQWLHPDPVFQSETSTSKNVLGNTDRSIHETIQDLLGASQLVQRYQQQHPNDRVIVVGGTAAAWWVHYFKSEVLPIHDVDVLVQSSESETVIVDRWLALLPGYQSTMIDQGIYRLTPVSTNQLSLDLFIEKPPGLRSTTVDDLERESDEVVDGLRVPSYQSLLDDVERSLHEHQLDLQIAILDESERQEIVNRMKRKQQLYTMMS